MQFEGERRSQVKHFLQAIYGGLQSVSDQRARHVKRGQPQGTAVPPPAPKPAKGKQGPRGGLSKAERIAAVKEWDGLDRDINPITLEEWLNKKFGNTAGQLNVPLSTFHGWRKLVETP
jgi:hypothetical protein